MPTVTGEPTATIPPDLSDLLYNLLAAMPSTDDYNRWSARSRTRAVISRIMSGEVSPPLDHDPHEWVIATVGLALLYDESVRTDLSHTFTQRWGESGGLIGSNLVDLLGNMAREAGYRQSPTCPNCSRNLRTATLCGDCADDIAIQRRRDGERVF